jgi:uncharacterized membrane protein
MRYSLNDHIYIKIIKVIQTSADNHPDIYMLIKNNLGSQSNKLMMGNGR